MLRDVIKARAKAPKWKNVAEKFEISPVKLGAPPAKLKEAKAKAGEEVEAEKKGPEKGKKAPGKVKDSAKKDAHKGCPKSCSESCSKRCW